MGAPKKTPAANSESKLVTILVTVIVLLVGLLIAGSFWLQNQRQSDVQRMRAERQYETYLEATRPARPARVETPLTPSERELAAQEARETRTYLMNHPAVTPGSDFDKPGVQATGKAIVQAIDNAKGL